jgi:hypothetical protein
MRAQANANKALIETQAKLRDLQISSAVSLALTRAKAVPSGLDLLPAALQKRITVETADGADVLRIMQPDGKTHMTGSGVDGLANLDDLMRETIEQYPDLFQARNNGGGGARGGRPNSLGPKTMLRSTFNTLDAGEQMDRMKSGWKLVDN